MACCYVIADIEVRDAVAYKTYQIRVPATVAKHGGRFIARDGNPRPLEGGWAPHRIVIIEFPSEEQAMAWWNCAENVELRELRNRVTVSRLVFASGLA